MAASFAAYASHYYKNDDSAMSSSSQQPMFFSFTTDDDGSRHGGHDTDLDDLDDPHLRQSAAGDDQDPYLRLDEDNTSQGSPAGWLAHLANSPRRSPQRSPSPDSSDSSPPTHLLQPQGQPQRQVQPQSKAQPQPPSPPPPPPQAVSLTDSLLPHDTAVFSLPDPRHIPRSRRKHHDAAWISLWLGLVSGCLVFAIVLLFTTRRPAKFPSSMLPYTVLLRTVPMLVILTCVSAAAAYLHVYLLRLFVKPVMVATSVFVPATLLLSAIWAFVGSFMWDGDTEPTWGETVGLRLFSLIPLTLSLITARRLVHLPRSIHTTSSILTLSTQLLIANPFLLGLSPLILLATLLASIPFVTLVFRLLLIGYTTESSTGGIVEWHVRAYAHWAIALVLGVWLWSWAVTRGVLRTTCASVVGAWYFADPTLPPPPPTSTHTIHAALTRSTGPSLGSIVLAALLLTLLRILALTALLLHRLPPLLLAIPWVPLAVPVATYVVPGVRIAIAWMEDRSSRLSRYALVYAGLTGVGFWESARKGRTLVNEINSQMPVIEEESAGPRRTRRQRRGVDPTPRRNVNKTRFNAEPPLALLAISPLTLTLPFSLLTYLFVAHTLRAPHEALGAALLAGGVTALVGLFCVGVVRDTADALYLCYCIDKAAGERRREEVFIAFEYDGSAGSAYESSVLPQHSMLPQHMNNQRQPPRQNAPPSGQTAHNQKRPSHPRNPETIIPRSPLSQRRELESETLFDANDESDLEAQPRSAGRRQKQPPHSRRSPGVGQQLRAKTTPLTAYLSEDEDEEEQMPTTVLPPRRAGRHDKGGRAPKQEEDEDLDPFSHSAIEEETGRRRASGGVPITTGVSGALDSAMQDAFGGPTGGFPSSTSPPRGAFGMGGGLGKVGFGFAGGHRRGASGAGSGSGSGSGGVALGGLLEPAANTNNRMLTSTQELNMKSQFLMNMRAFGAESQASEAGSQGSRGASRSQAEVGAGESMVMSAVSARLEGEDADDDEEGKESQLGPGSDFFK